MVSALVFLMYAIVGPFAILNLYAKTLMRRAYQNQILLKIAASIVSLGVGCQIAYKYRSYHTFIWLTSSLLTLLLNYWYVIPLLLIYILPILHKIIQHWLSLVEIFSKKLLQPSSTKFRQLLPSIWTFESNEKLWPIESIRFMLTYGSIGPGLYCGYVIYSYLIFGISFNLCIVIAITFLITTTSWHVLDAIDRDLYPFIFAIILQYYIIPVKSALNIPLTILLTTFLFPFLNNLLTSNSIREFINNIRLLNSRTFFETNTIYKQFYSEFVNLFLTFYLTYSVFIVCLTSDISRLLTIAILGFLPIYLYTHFISLIIIEPNTIMFIFSSFILSKFILNRRNEEHFIYKYFLVIMLLTFYFAFIYPLLYHILRRLAFKSAKDMGLQLKLFRQNIHEKTSEFSNKYLHITYIHDPSKYFVLHVCNVIIAICLLTIVPINIILRLVLSVLSYLLIGRLLLTRGLEILGIFTALCTSITAGALVYAHYDNSLLLTMSIALITYISTLVIAFSMMYRFVQFVFIHIPFLNYLDRGLQKSYAFAWSYFDIVWPHIKASFNEVRIKIERSKINLFGRSKNRQ